MAGRGGRAALLLQYLQEEDGVKPGTAFAEMRTDLAPALPQVGRSSQGVALATGVGSTGIASALNGKASNTAGPAGMAGVAQAIEVKPVLTGNGRGTTVTAIREQKEPEKVSPKELSPANSVGSGPRHSSPPMPPLSDGNLELGASLSSRGRGGTLPTAAAVGSGSRAAGDMTNAMAKVQKGIAPGEVQPPKKEKGTQGSRQPMVANYVRLRSENPQWYQYQVTFKPEVESRAMRTKMLCDQARIHRAKIFDGTILFIPHELPKKVNVYTAVRQTDNVSITIEVALTKTLTPGDEACVQTYNVLFKRIQNLLKWVQVGRHSYDPQKAIRVTQHKLEIWPGYVVAVKEHEGGLLLVCDVSHRVLRTETVHQIMSSITATKSTTYQEACTRELVGCTVLTRYNNKTYRIDDIDFTMSPMSKFDMRGQEVSFVDYYQRHYATKIEYPDQPMLISRAKRRDQGCDRELICLVPELCCMTGLTDAMRQDFRIMKDLATHTRVLPAQRSAAIKEFLSRVNNCPEAVQMLADWGLHLENVTLQLEGRVYDPEMICFRNNQVSAGPDASWLRHISNNLTITSVDLRDWLLIYPVKDKKRTEDFVTKYRQCSPAMGISLGNPVLLEIVDDRTDTYIRSIRDNLKSNIQCVVIILSSKREDRYNALKKLLTVECPVPSQVILSYTLGQPQKLTAIVQRVGLQINCKLGGELWAVPIPLKNLMVVGIDVYHDKAARTGSVAGLVATINHTLTRFYSRVYIQGAGEELISGLKPCLLAALRKYDEVNHCLPEKIIVYRDGVGDGMLRVVGTYETDQLLKTFESFSPGYKPQLAVVVVQKRINTRLFTQLSIRDNDLGNPRPGSVIDHTITRKDWYDFFLVSQHVTQGTVSPTHYVVVYDDTTLKSDHMQKLAYKMTHLYYNWPGTIRVPALCQYAHKLAYFVGQNTKKEASLALADRLYYI